MTLRLQGFDSAVTWLADAGLSPEEMDLVAKGLGYNATRENHAKWLSWMAGNLPAERRDAQVGHIISKWTSYDFEAAGIWLARAPDDAIKPLQCVLTQKPSLLLNRKMPSSGRSRCRREMIAAKSSKASTANGPKAMMSQKRHLAKGMGSGKAGTMKWHRCAGSSLSLAPQLRLASRVVNHHDERQHRRATYSPDYGGRTHSRRGRSRRA